ncbi:GH36-type glycosyl hydrolase domain-containing protein [Janthinobacterium agaricidamnosum]|uniref:Glycosyltransferase 36 associated family protein n=1 Tax=Janthinobacterium agaricidamnosum NBRC 102515 = DSM 9628 TaxID=1349767 RepID=W0VD47_9BURK|nr:glycosyltransferase 36 associated family protein [Janthinobacterium agaricidamnosum NBRC 102515 = DSM 9628]
MSTLATLSPVHPLSDPAEDDLPLRSELFSAMQMAAHGKILAASHHLASKRGGSDQLLARLADNAAVITNTVHELTAAVKSGRQVTPASEWLLDNFYLIEEQIRTAKRHLPKDYSKELPRLGKGPDQGCPRAYKIALEIISHGDARVDLENLCHFVEAYQDVATLTLGELWAIPIMLRLSLIENLRRVAARVAEDRIQRDLANTWADQMTEVAERNPSGLILLVADMARANPSITSAFVAELARRLQGQSQVLTLALSWVTHKLAESGLTIEQQIQVEIQQQAADQVSIANSIGSLRFLGTMDWQEFVETMSVVEQTLRCDPSGIYGKMDFSTRDRYRHVVERIAKRSPKSETEVAELALRLARNHGGGEADPRFHHIGFYLVGRGVIALEKLAGATLPLGEALQKTARAAPLTAYLGAIAILTVVTSALLLERAVRYGIHGWLLGAIGVLALLGSGQLALALVNWLATLLTSPHPLPRMDYKSGIPSDARGIVVVPTLIYSEQNVAELCEALEVRYLANRDDNLRFCLLTDFVDASDESMPGDAALLRQAQETIRRMNDKYRGEGGFGQSGPTVLGAPFLLLHRPRQWNPQQQCWMGAERKRGKLSDMNRFLRGGARDRFMVVEGDTDGLDTIKYAITLDTDTQLPRDAARQFIATMMHPLNRPRVDARLRRVVAGYGILQPRVAVALPSANASRYEQLCGGEPGIDPYTRTVSDLYQDVFYEGSYIGKGIYDIDTFEQVLGERLPDNRILSHDLLEGCYLRAGLLSDAQLYEEYPARYDDDVSRRQRWIRGDWQLIGWLFGRVPGRAGTRERNPLSALSRWKLFDNLRRSVVALATTLSLLLAWAVLPHAPFWTAVILGIIFVPPLFTALYDLAVKPRDTLWRQHMMAFERRCGLQFSHAMLTLVFLPYEAYFSLDAIVRTLWRLNVSHRQLLEWRASNVFRSGASLAGNWRAMWISPLLALAAGAGLLTWRPQAFAAAAVILLLWLIAPLIAWWISRPVEPKAAALSPGQQRFLHGVARKTWTYFDTFVGPENHWLPPDNMQEHPVAVVAHRTSPTNIGLALLANLSAWDFGYITGGQLVERSGNTLRSMGELERHQGHFYNWYDTQSLKPLLPMYISTVDSGNLAGHLLTLQPGLVELYDQPIIGAQIAHGLGVTFDVLAESCAVDGGGRMQIALAGLQAALAEPAPSSLPEWHAWLKRMVAAAEQLPPLTQPGSDPLPHMWADALVRQCRAALFELVELAPWVALAGDTVFDSSLARVPTLRELADLNPLAGVLSDLAPQERERQQQLAQLVAQGSALAAQRMRGIAQIAAEAHNFAQIEYGFLYNPATKLLAIGYNVSERRLDASYYDLLASEVRLASFVAIAQGQLPQEHWFALGRQLCMVAGQPVLLSWSGSMFEYLMPLLVMPNYPNTLLDQTYQSVIGAQIDYGRQRDVPWGVSESGYNTVDASLNYQYRAFGVPGLGLKRGLADDLVVAPYASMLGLMVQPEAACHNLQRLQEAGFMGRYGFYEAIDYTSARLPRGQASTVIRSFMVHHQGMGLLALSYLLHERPMQRRFASDPLLQSALLVLQERTPQAGAFYSNTADLAALRSGAPEQTMPMRILHQVHSPMPETHLLSNGRYHVMVTSAGAGYSRWKDLSVTRWREDSTRDNWGNFCYLRDLDDGETWSTTYQPTLVEPKKYEVIFSEGRAEFRRSDKGLDLYTEIVVSPEDDIEMRRTRISNTSDRRRKIEITSYAEVVMAPAAADAAHPAFSKLFVQTEILRQENAIVCTRRPRSRDEQMPWLLHVMTVHDGLAGPASFETDRAEFIGRGRATQLPRALRSSAPLKGGQGSVLDPVVAIRYSIVLEPDQVVTVDVVTGMTDTRDAALHLIDKYQDRHLADRVFELAWTHSQVVLRQLNASEADAQLYGRLANTVIYPNAALRADASILIRNQRGQSGLWAYAISGDLPIVLLQIRDPANIELARQMVQAHAYWRLKGLVVDLVIWYEDQSGYRQALHDQIMGLIASGIDAQAIDRPGGIFVRLAEQIGNEDRILLQSVARAIISDSRGTLAEQIKRSGPTALRMPPLLSSEPRADIHGKPWRAAPRPLILENGLGGFTPDGREYVITASEAQRTPAPWCNVLANAQFGSVVSESGQAYTWHENAHEFRLTPWHNDPVSDGSGEAFYVRDEQSGHFWSPGALPARGSGDYVTRHGFGYSVFEHSEADIATQLSTYVALDAAVKYSVLKVRNDSTVMRRLSVTGYVEWVMGDLRAKSCMHIATEVDTVSGALFARNAYNTEFSGRVAFFTTDASIRSITCDRNEFIGRNGSLANPAALRRLRLSGKAGTGLDPCAAIQVPFELLPGQEREIVFILGVGGRRNADASGMVQRHCGAAAAHDMLAGVCAHWESVLGAVQIDTPDPALDVIANGWLMYQTIACRLWARSGYYQSGGAYGFRDQLQDAMAMIHTQPQLLRAHLLLCAAHQFVEGDVQHWWHPPSDRGVRTHCSDDYLWLPLAVCRYVTATGDLNVLSEVAPFLEGRAVKPEEDSYYDMPSRSGQSADLYEHCVRAIRHGLRFGVHGLPLIGSCDWNDGMDKVGEHGKGESVWLAFFLYEVLQRFAEVALLRGDNAFAALCREEALRLAANVENNAWDGEWYRRAYFDDGTPLGSHLNEECQIDSISQSWGVLSGAADPQRVAGAMRQVDARLVRRDAGLIQLLDPPFDKSDLNPGYIRGYVPGVRENGGQYTHAAIWTAMAFARMGDGERAWELLNLINPVKHGATAESGARYKVEPYVVTADVYGVAPHVGRGGWSWYTGSSGWMYRLIVESLLGLGLEAAQLTLAPRLPADWDGFKLAYRYGGAVYAIEVRRAAEEGEAGLSVDGVRQPGNVIMLADDGEQHAVLLLL